ncbi:MAG TPA: carbohydrate-binding protein, partial [Flavisolibacter sp.]
LLNAAGTTLATVNVPNTGWWQTWQTATATVTLPAGQQTLRVLSSSADAWNFNWFELAAGSGGGTPTNQLPTVTAGIDQTITLPANSVQLGGSATDPDGTIAAYAWSKVSGPAEGSFNSTTGTNPTFSGLVQGTYTLKLTVTDNSGATASDDVVITVNPAVSTPPTGPATRIQAESWTAMSGVGTEGTSDAGGGLSVGWIDNQDWMDYSANLAQAGTYTVSFRVASPAASGQLQLRSSNGTILATVSVPNTGWWQTWQTVTATVTLPAGQQTLRVVSTHPDAWNFNWFELAPGAAISTRGLQEETEVVEEGSASIEAVEVFPNPVSDRFVLKVSSPLTGTMQVQVVDMNGSVAKQFNLQKLSAGTSQSYLSVQGLAKGEYLLRVQLGQWTRTVKLVKL